MQPRSLLAVAFAAATAIAPVLATPVSAGTAGPAVAGSAMDAVTVSPKVVIVVGATESVTPTYRSMADSIATEALKYTPNVVKVYSPYATWAAVKAAAQGASIFVYLGHGNGFPSPYSTSLVPDKQDGMGLNTTLGLGDTDKKYYGESCVDGLAAANDTQCPNNGTGIRLAPNAIVFLNHLCYAPGAGEPGSAEPTISVAQQRVDNFASGFIRAGARAVMADDDTGVVEASIRGIFTTHQAFLNVWRSLYSAHGHELPFVPSRNPAFQAILDPATWTTGFTRSIVTDATLTTDSIVAGAAVPPTSGSPSTLAAPGNAAVATAGLPVSSDDTLATPTGAALASGTKVHVAQLAAQPTAPDGTTPPPAAQVTTYDGSVTGWVSSGGLTPADSTSPALWSMTGPTTISPNYDGTNDRLNLWGRLSEPATWTWTLADPGGTALRTSSGSTDLLALTWDALPGGSPAPAGTYHWTLHAVDAWGNALDTGGDVTVVTQPIPTTAVLAFKPLNGTATTSTSLAYELDFASAMTGLTASDFVRTGTATSCAVAAPSGGPSTWYVTLSGCSAGTVVLTLSAGSVLDSTSTAGPPVAVAAPTVVIDLTKPVATAPRVGLRTGVSITTSSYVAAAVVWSATDSGGSGIRSYDLARSVDGGSFTVILSGTTATSYNIALASGHTYRFEARARDRAGNVGAWVAAASVYPSLVQQTVTAVVWGGSWATASSTSYSGGSARTTSTAGASATYTFTGRVVSVVMSRDPAYGQVKVYFDGVLISTVDTVASTHQDRVITWARSVAYGTHTVKLVVVGTAGRPKVVLDAFEVIR